MSEKIEFRLVSPERNLFEEPVALAVMPGEAGQFGVGAGHTSLVASLQTGVVDLYADSKADTPRQIFITGGFADVTNEKCVVLAEEAVNVSELDGAALGADQASLQRDLEAANNVAAQSLIRGQLDVVTAKLDAIANAKVSRF